MDKTKKPTREDVIKTYNVMLGRDPENDTVISEHLDNAETVHDLVKTFAGSIEFTYRVGYNSMHYRLYNFNTCVDVKGIIESHVNKNRSPMPGHIVNFLGVAMPLKVMPNLTDKEGQLDPVPIPSNYHSDMAEWAAVLRSVDLAHDTYTIIELGCGWGCWMNNTAAAARAKGLRIQLVGIEADEKHIQFAHEALKINKVRPDEYTLHRGIVATQPGSALFPKNQNKDEWGSKPIFDHESNDSSCVDNDQFERLQTITLSDVINEFPKVDLIHMDIQGGEADLIEQSIDLLSEKVGYLVIGTHSRTIEGKLFDTLLNAGWILEVERPTILDFVDDKPFTLIDGVQGWRNPCIHRDEDGTIS